MWKQPHAQMKNLGCGQVDSPCGRNETRYNTFWESQGHHQVLEENIPEIARYFQNKTDSDLTQNIEDFLLMGTDRTPETGLLGLCSSLDVFGTNEQCLDRFIRTSKLKNQMFQNGRKK